MSKDKKDADPSAKKSKEKEVASGTTETAPKKTKEANTKSLNEFIERVAKKHGDSEVMILGNAKRVGKLDVVSSGSVSLDTALGCGGLPRGRVIEIYGPEASGKTTTTLSIIAEAQKLGLNCGFIDAEQALDVTYAKKLGVKFDETLTYVQPNSGEQALQLGVEMVASGLYGVIVVDSVAALTPQKEIDGEIEDNNMGLQARMMGKALRVLTPVVAKNNVLFVFINQLREKIGVMYGDPTTTPGGKALPFYASVRLRVSKMGGKDDKLEVVMTDEKNPEQTKNVEGYLMKVMIKKNKMSGPHEDVKIPILYGYGIYTPMDLLTAGKETGVIEGSRTHTFGEIVLGKSADEALIKLHNDPELCKQIDKAIKAVRLG